MFLSTLLEGNKEVKSNFTLKRFYSYNQSILWNMNEL